MTVVSASVFADAVGYDISVHGPCHLIPDRAAFGPDGAMYIGTDVDEGLVQIYRIDSGGGAGGPFGDPLFDPDAVVVDFLGTFTGEPGAVLVAGHGDEGGYLAKITADGTTTDLSVGTWPENVGEMVFDSTGTILYLTGGFAVHRMTSLEEGAVFVFTVKGDGPQFLTLDDADRIYTTTSEGFLYRYDPADGEPAVLIATGLGFIKGLSFASGDVWGHDLFLISKVGLLYRLNSANIGVRSLQMCGNVTDAVFGPGGDLYVVRVGTGGVLRVAANGDGYSADLNLDGRVDFEDVLLVLAKWAACIED